MEEDRAENQTVQNIPRGYRYTMNGLLLVSQLAYFSAGAYLLDNNLEHSKVLQMTLPVAMTGMVAGAFAIRAGYSAVANGLAKKLF
jgi:hypothetical protein